MMVLPALGLAMLASIFLGITGKSSGQKLRLNCESSPGAADKNALAPILEVMKEDAQQEIDNKEVKEIALYYRDLKSGSWIAINKDEKFTIASLIKVPLMIEGMESAESHPKLLKTKMYFTSDTDWNTQQNFKPAKIIERGKPYLFDDVMFRMIAYSDNNAMQMLLEEFPSDTLLQFFATHNIDYEKAPEGIKMSLGTYSWFFESLYDKTLLNSAMSQKALSYLGAEDFPQGMHAAVPSDVKVESKFGEKLLTDENGRVASTQLHEVGIVLDGDRPFLIGIMTDGKNLPALEKVIRDITHDVYLVTKKMAALSPDKMNCMHGRCH